MTLAYLPQSLGLNIRSNTWKPRRCKICKRMITKPSAKNQKVHDGACRRELAIRRAEKAARKKAAAKVFKKERKRIGAIKGNKPERDPKYLAFLRTQECVRPNCKCKKPYWSPEALSARLRKVEAAHTGPHGKSVKAPDPEAIPLCRWAHQEAKDAQGKSRTWFEDHGLDRDKVIAELHARYKAERKAA